MPLIGYNLSIKEVNTKSNYSATPAPVTSPKAFVKWAGGKRQILPEIKKRMPNTFGNYFEPFVGGGSVMFSLMPDSPLINDINPQLINAYKQIKENPSSLIEAINELDARICDVDFYKEVRQRFNDKISSRENDVESAALMIWLNKHCFNGLYRVNSKGLFNVPYNNAKDIKSLDPDNIYSISSFLNNKDAKILCGDFAVACDDVRVGDFVYFDSPYLPQSPTANFVDYAKDGFNMNEHERLAKLFRDLDGRGAKLMLSNNNVPLAHELYDGFNISEISANRSINRNGNARKGKEVIITNYDYSL